MRQPFEWDDFSDQPRIILDKGFKRNARLRYATDYLKMVATALAIFPIATLKTLCPKYPDQDARLIRNPDTEESLDFFGMGVSLKHGKRQVELIQELGIYHVLLRVPLWDIQRLSDYRKLASDFRSVGVNVLINVLQDREHIENLDLFERNLRSIFETFSGIASQFQIANAINRVKWGFFSVKEYLDFYLTAQTLRDKHFSNLELLGPSVIDFEYHYTIRALFNDLPVHFDRLSALLYVDRMGAPDNRQYGIFDTELKVGLLGSLARMSSRVKNKGIYITETNWPLSGTAPWTPTSEKECVSEENYCVFMMRYHEVAKRSGVVSRIYWHQLIAPGYGLADNRDGYLRKTAAFSAYKNMVSANLRA